MHRAPTTLRQPEEHSSDETQGPLRAPSRHTFVASLALTAVLAASRDAGALVPSSTTVGHPELELASTANGAISHEVVWDSPPRNLAGAFRNLRSEVGGDYRASFNALTGVPSRLFGRGLPAKDTIASSALASAFARTFLAKHVRLLAPGSDAADFDIVSNDLDDTASAALGTTPMRTVGMRQMYMTPAGHRLEVRGGQVSFRFKNDELVMIGSEAIPTGGMRLELPSPVVGTTDVAKAAVAAVVRDFGHASAIGNASDPFILPFVNDGGRLELRIVRSIVVETEALHASSPPGAPLARFEVFVDARTGSVVARRELLRFDSASLALHVTTRAPSYGPRVDAPAIDATLTVDAAGSLTDPSGLFTFTGPVANVTAYSRGTDVDVTNHAGTRAQIDFQSADTSTFVWDASGDEVVDAQLDAFVHAREVREYAKSFAPDLAFLNQQVFVTVNINDICNAFSDGTNINFYDSGSGCENTGRIADVVYHEFGHSIHAHAIIQGVGFWDGALSEGIADYLAGTITGDHGMGRGFYFTDAPLRDLDPTDHKNHWPEDLVGEVHEDGKIIGQTLWELRKELIDKLGTGPGIARANYLFYEGIRRAVDIPSMYPEVLAADDDDGDLENGTPNICEINRAFALHGLRAYSAEGSPLALEPVRQEGYSVTAKLHGLFAQCPDDALTSATLVWHPESDPGATSTMPMQVNGSDLSATIPTQPDGSVVRYSLEIGFAGTSDIFLPNNPADRWYQFYIGDVTPLYCTSFQSDPAADGWTHGLSMGGPASGADDWEWGKPAGTATNGDPTAAFSGDKAFGNDLGDLPNHDGLYQADKVSFALSPVVDTTGYDTVRLQYRRWLTVEDGHFDHARIYANGHVVWENADSNQGDNSTVDHTDKEWRFADVDLTKYVKGDHVQVKYELDSDPAKQLGGWTIDDFCIVGVKRATTNPCVTGPCVDPGVGGGGGTNAAPSLDSPAGGACACSVTTLDVRSRDFTAGFALVTLAAALVRRRARRRVSV